MKLIVIGAKGRMGERICALAKKDTAFEKVIEASSQNPLSELITKADVLIDFSKPAATLQAIDLAVKHQKPIVIGTTGFTKQEQVLLEKKAANVPTVLAPNMAIGVNIFWALIEKATQALKNFDIAICETHHIHKKDKPSGTAKQMGRIVGSIRGTMPKIEAFREGEVIGNHQIEFSSPLETIKIEHSAHSRDAFALGSLAAAKWIANKDRGIYTMHDVLEIS